MLDLFVLSDGLFDDLNRDLDFFSLLENFIYRSEFICSLLDSFFDFLISVNDTFKRSILVGRGFFQIF